MTVFPKNLGQTPAELLNTPLSSDASAGSSGLEALPLDDIARELAQGESVLSDLAASDSITLSSDSDGPGGSGLIDLSLRSFAPLGVSMGQTTTELASFGSASSGLFALAEPDVDAVQMTPMSGCSCMACMSGASSGQGGGLGAPGAAVSLQSLADYLRVTFWADFDGQSVQYYNVTNSGTGANNGVLYYNVTGTPSGGVSTYYGTYTDTNGVVAARQALIRDAFAFYEELLGIDFVETTSTGTDVDFFFIDNDAGRAWQAPRFHSGKGGPIDHSVINVAAGWQGGESTTNGYTYQTFLHEIGHALGLGHQGLYNAGSGSPTYANSALFANDSWAQSMMSYWDQGENTEFSDDSVARLLGPSAADFIALQALYGSQGYGTNNAFNGTTIYGVGTNITTAQNRQFNDLANLAATNFFTIIDADGIDTVDFSNYNVNQNINLTVTLTTDLRPTFSSVGGLSKNMALAAGTVIENATTGGGNDTLTGNQFANTLDGGAGNDTLYGGNGADNLYGGDGADSLYGGNNGDTLKGGAGADNLFGESGNDYLKGGAGDDTLYGGAGTDTVEGNDGNDRIVLQTTAVLALAGFYGGTETDVLEVNGAGTWDLRNSTVTGFEELEFFANGSNSDKSVYLTGAQAIALGAAALIDGNNNTGSDDVVYIYMEDSGTTSLDLSGWVFQDWVQTGAQQDNLYVFGGATNDTVSGSSRNDGVYGGDGGDSLTGNNGDDFLKGGAGSDTLFGGAGNDTMYGNDGFSAGDGVNTFYAGSGNDVAYGGDSYDYFYGGAAASTSAFYGGDGDDSFYKASGTTAGVSETWSGGNGNDWLVWSDATMGATQVVNLSTGFITEGGANRDVVQGIENVWLENGAGIIGDGASNTFWAFGDFANDIDAGAGNDTIKGGAGNDVLRGGTGIDYLQGDDGDDTIYDGNDLAGADSIYGGQGNDTLVKQSWTGAGAIKVWNGGDGIDTLDWNHTGNAIDSQWVVNLAAGQIFVSVTFGRDLLSNIENVIVRNGAQIVGSAGDNVLTAIGAFNNTIEGGDGNDSIEGGAGLDTLYGGTGADTVVGGDDDDFTAGDAGNDALYGGAGFDQMYGGADSDYLFGDSEGDYLYGDAGNDTLDGWTGDDVVYGGTGTDYILGYEGNDALYGGAGIDTLYGEDGDDYLATYAGEAVDHYYGGFGTDTLDLSSTTLKYTINLAAGTYTGGASAVSAMDSIEILYLGSGNDSVLGSSAAEIILGAVGQDTLVGGGGADSLYGGNQGDVLHSGAGAVILSGDNGNDTVYLSADLAGFTDVYGGEGTDWLNLSEQLSGVSADLLTQNAFGAAFTAYLYNIENIEGSALADSLLGTGLNNQLNGGSGNDTLDGRAGNDTLRGGAGNDSILGGGGLDSLLGGTGNDTLDGGSANDTLRGDDGRDSLIGGTGNDLLDGGAVADTLIGGAGTDTLIGGFGADVFRFNTSGEIGLGANSDQVLDFVSGQDKIDLSAFATALTFIGTSGFSNTAGELRYYALGGVGYLAGDTTGNGVANFELLFINGAVVVGTDLIL